MTFSTDLDISLFRLLPPVDLVLEGLPRGVRYQENLLCWPDIRGRWSAGGVQVQDKFRVLLADRGGRLTGLYTVTHTQVFGMTWTPSWQGGKDEILTVKVLRGVHKDTCWCRLVNHTLWVKAPVWVGQRFFLPRDDWDEDPYAD